MCDARVWEHQAESLGALATVEIPNHGRIDSLGRMAEALLDRAPARFALAGHSMGGRVAFEVIRRAPERVTKLALLDTAYKARTGGEHGGDQEKAERYALLEKARSEGMRAMGIQWVQRMVHPARLDDAPLIESILDMISRHTPEIFAAQIKALLDRPDATPLLSQIQCPTMVLCGREDAWSGLKQHEDIASLIPNSNLVVIENCGHMSTMERPDEVSAVLTRWLSV
jgi:pimeloyl-ACP methyl ester carboxylesterase